MGHRACRDLKWKGQVKEMYLEMFFEGWMDRQQQVVSKRRGKRVKSSCTCDFLDPRDWQTIIFVRSQWAGWEWCGNHGVKINRQFFTQGFVGQQIDLGHYSKPYRQPLKGTEQWNTSSKQRRFCHQVDSEHAETLWGQCRWYHTKTDITKTTGHK